MPGFYQDFTAVRTTEPHYETLLSQLKALDPTAGIVHEPGTLEFRIKKATVWTQPQINAAQNVLNTAPATTPRLVAQAEVDRLGIREKAIILALIDQLNVIRSKLSPPLGDITPAAAIAAIRTKAGEL